MCMKMHHRQRSSCLPATVLSIKVDEERTLLQVSVVDDDVEVEDEEDEENEPLIETVMEVIDSNDYASS